MKHLLTPKLIAFLVVSVLIGVAHWRGEVDILTALNGLGLAAVTLGIVKAKEVLDARRSLR